ncbi:HAD family hydrolase [Arthrobacter sp.]|uniref:HAD family hydrolase n=1 Tax=Arthrobacter sp. TaxID=1667 RepID=UPI003A8FAA57
MRLIASDLDGTILHADESISARTVAAFAAARNAGLHVVFVTGRPFRWLGPVQRAFGHLGTVICSNGALVYDLEAESILASHTISGSTVLQVQRRIRSLEPGAVFAAETLKGLLLEPGFLDEAASRARIREAVEGPFDVGLLDADGVVKLLAKTHQVDAEAFQDLVEPRIGGLVSVTHSAPGVALLEMAHPEVNKAVTLADYAAGLGIGADEVLAFGDMPNDVQMLAWAGRGYAVDSGHPLAKTAAGRTTASLHDDGVARVIERYLAGDPV